MITTKKHNSLIKNKGVKVAKGKKYQVNPAWGVNQNGKFVPKLVWIHGEKVKPGTTVELDENEAAELLGRQRIVKDPKTGKPVSVPMLIDAPLSASK